MAEPTASRPADSGWDGDWDAHAARRRRAWLATTPQQRLVWLEEAIGFARQAGALRAPRAEGDVAPGTRRARAAGSGVSGTRRDHRVPDTGQPFT